MISIKEAVLREYDSSYGGFPYQINIVIELSKKAWTKAKKQEVLGYIYNRDVSNALYQITEGKMPYCEVMCIEERRSKGEAKEVELRYLFKDHNAAQELGLPGRFINFKDEPRFVASFASSKDLLERGAR